LFSLGQAHQKQFRASGKSAHLEGAIDSYRRYLAADESGARHDTALKALNALLPIAERLRSEPGEARPAARVFGRLLLSSRTPGAVLSVSGETVASLPAALELPADQYTVEASAEGYVSEKHQIQVAAGTVTPVSIELRPQPAFLLISGPEGAEAYVDGRPVGFLPLPAALSLVAGSHLVSLRQFGKKTRTSSVVVKRGQTATVELDLVATAQRKAAYGFGIGSLATLAVTGVSIGLLASADDDAADLDAERKALSLTPEEANRLNERLESRNDYRALAVGTGALAAGLLGVGMVLYFSDNPEPPGRDTASLPRLEPWLAPGLLGTGVRGNF
jgi:hypothetical protein